MKLLFSIAVAALILGFYQYGKKVRAQKGETNASAPETKTRNMDIQPEYVEGMLSFADVIGYFKSLSLKKDEDTPFMAKATCQKLKDVIKVTVPSGYEALLIGVYGENVNELKHAKLIFARSLDERIVNTLGNEELVVLS